jgi:hypothetical protein
VAITGVAMQHTCIFCLRAQYGPSVWDVSHGDAVCCWCGVLSKPLNLDEFTDLLNSRRKREALESGWELVNAIM